MIIDQSILSKEELLSYRLRQLYSSNCYKQYKMSKFEEYDLYAKNKDFLVSSEVITFTDTDGRLLALKPDVTLSVIKNGKDGEEKSKLYYDEKVYRVSKGTKSFKEITQAGVEYIGKVDLTALAEVLYLAVNSLEIISCEHLLEITDLDIVSLLLEQMNLSEKAKIKVFNNLSCKNYQGIKEICNEEQIDIKQTEMLASLARIHGAPSVVFEKLESYKTNQKIAEKITQLQQVIELLTKKGVKEENLCIDFSVVEDLRYYNGLAFKGYVKGVPTSVLSGGQYDNLMKKMKRSSSAIGFAVYIDEACKI